MFYEVRVLDKTGDIKKVISSKKLSKKFWDKHTQPQEFSGKQNYEETEPEPEWKPEVSGGRVELLNEVYE